MAGLKEHHTDLAQDQAQDWEFDDQEAGDYEWEYEEEEEEEEGEEQEAHGPRPDAKPKPQRKDEEEEEVDEDEDEELPDPLSGLNAVKKNGHDLEKNGNGHHEEPKADPEVRTSKKSHKKSRHLERMEMFSKNNEDEDHHHHHRKKKIHVRSKDPSKIAKQFEKSLNQQPSSGKSKGRGGGKAGPVPMPVNQICKICGKEPYVVERVVAEKSWWHKNCFRCKVCNKALSLDTYMSHEGILYCKPHHRELFQPKVVVRENDDSSRPSTLEVIERHKVQESKMETIIRENKPVELGDKVVKSGRGDKYAGLENLDVGSKFRMFERSSESPEKYEGRAPASDRFGIMEKLKRLQEGEDLDDLLAEIDEELPSSDNDDDLESALTNVQRRTQNAEKLFSEGGSVRREKMADQRRNDLKVLRQKLMAGSKDNAIDHFDDLLNASANKIKKTKVDVRSENAKKFREMFDKGQVPEVCKETDRKHHSEKDAELELMRKGRREQRDYFKKMESGQLDDPAAKAPKEKLLVGKLKGSSTAASEEVDEGMLEMAPLANRFSFFENFKDKEGKKSRTHKEHADNEVDADTARKECKARSVLNKFKEMEQKALSGEPETVAPDDPDKPVMTDLGFLGRLPGVTDKRRPTLKRFTPPRRIDDSDSEYSDSESGSDYSYSDSYSSSSYSDSEGEEDETLKAIRAAARAKQLRAKFEEWEQSQDARDQLNQMMIYDENGDCLETATNLRAKFEALQLYEKSQSDPKDATNFKVKRFK